MATDIEFVPNATYSEKPENTCTGVLVDELLASIETGRTVVFGGSHGIGKTQSVQGFCRDLGLRYVPIIAANMSIDELLINAPAKLTDENERATYVLRELLMDALGDHKGLFFVHVDDLLQAGNPALDNALMQMAADWSVGAWNLKAHGMVGLAFTDNMSNVETATSRTDIPMLSRMTTVSITAKDVPWKEALARIFPEHDLTDVFKAWNDLPTDIRTNVMSPRCLEHLIANLVNGNPGIWALPLMNGNRVRLATTDKDGRTVDRTEEFINRVARALNAPNPERVSNPVARVVAQAIRNNWSVLIEGDPGIGKTELVKATVRDLTACDPLYFSMSTTDVDMLTIPMVIEGKLVQALREDIADPAAKTIVLDEVNRGKNRESAAKTMEMVQEKKIAGQPIPGLQGIIAMQNPPYVMGRKTMTQKVNIAQADRYFASVQLGPGDIPANEWLLNEWPDVWARHCMKVAEIKGVSQTPEQVAETAEKNRSEARRVIENILEWYKNDLDDEGRMWIAPRIIEALAKRVLTGRKLENALIHIDWQPCPVVLANLYARLADNPMTGLQEIAANLDEWVAKMKLATGVHGTVDTDTVHKALMFSEVSQLKEHEDTVVTLLAHIPPKYRLGYLTADGERKLFWISALAEMGKRVAAAQS